MKVRIRAILLVSMVFLGSLFVGWNFEPVATSPTNDSGRTLNQSSEPRSRINRGFNWSQIEVISEPIFGQNYNGDSSSSPRIAVENGKVYVVWQDDSNIDGAGTDRDIFYRYFDGNTWSKIQIISEPVAGDNKNTGASFNPDIAVENGNIYVVWHDNNDTDNAGTGDYDIFYRCNLTGSSWEPIQVISEPVQNNNFNDDQSWFPGLAVENSKIYVVWRDASDLYGAGANSDIFFRCNLTSTKWETIQVISEPVPGKDYHTKWSYNPDIAVENDNIYVVWQDQNDTNGAGTDHDIFYRCNLTGSSWEQVQVISEPVPGNDFNDEDSWTPSIAVENSKIFVAWRDETLTNGAGDDWDIFYRCNLSGLSWEKVQVISEPKVGNNYNSRDSYSPSIAIENGNIYVVWYDLNDTNSAGTDQDIFYRCNLTGSSWEKVQVISEPVVGYNYNTANSLIPNIVIDFGSIHVVWRDSNDTNGANTDSDIFYKWINQTSLSSLFLSSPMVNPLIGNTSTEFNFTVKYFHLNDSFPVGVKVFVDSIEYSMLEVDTADTNYINGKDYFFKIKNLDIGSHNYSFWASNGTKIITTFLMNFPNVVNTVPNITVEDYITALEDDHYEVSYEFEDLDVANVGQTCCWNCSTNATWLNFDNISAILNGTPTNDDVGKYWVNISISDTMDIDFTNFSLSVIDVNDDPIINTTNLEITNEDDLYQIDYNATDIDSLVDDQIWSLETNATSWLNINSASGLLNGTPTDYDLGKYWINVSVNDTEGGFDFTNFTITVLNVNDPPIIITEDILLANVSELYEVDYNATDIDSPVSAQTWTLTTASTWLTMDPSTGVLSGTPTINFIGLHNVNVSVDDGDGGLDWHEFIIAVKKGNDPPNITTSDIVSTSVDVLYYVYYEAVDDNTPLYQLTWYLTTNASWLNIGTTTGILSGIPTSSDLGWYWVNIFVVDSEGALDFHNFTLTVYTIPNIPPKIITTDVLWAEVNVEYSVDYEATDDRTLKNNLQWTLTTNASWLSLDANTGRLSGTPVLNDIGRYQVKVSVYDGENGWDHHDFVLTVSQDPMAENNAPVLTNAKMTPIEGDIETIFTFSVQYYDEDGDLPEYIQVVIDNENYLMGLKVGESALNGIYEYRTKLSVGNHSYYFTVSDGKDTIDTDIFLTSNINKVGKVGQNRSSWNGLIWVVIIVIIIMFFIIFTILRRRKKHLIPDVEYIPSRDAKDILSAGLSAKPGVISAPTVIIDQVAPTSQQTQIQPTSTLAAVPGQTPAIPAPTIAQVPQLPPATIETETPPTEPTPEATVQMPDVVPIPITTPVSPPEPTPIPAPVYIPAVYPEPLVAAETDQVTDFGIVGGPKPVQKDVVEHDVVSERVVEETDPGAATADLKAASVVDLAEEGAVVHDADTSIWRPDDKGDSGKIAENKEVLEQLKTLSELKLAGALTEEEFERKKKELLG